MSNTPIGYKIHTVMMRAVKDKNYKKELLLDPARVFKKEGIHLEKNQQPKILQNSDREFHVVIPAEKIPENIQLKMLPVNPSLHEIARWIITQVQEGTAFKEPLLAHAEEVLKKQGFEFPKRFKLVLHQNTPTTLYFVIPQGFKDDEELSDIEARNIG